MSAYPLSIKIIRVLVPTIFLAQLAIEYVLVLPIVERYNKLIEPLGFSSSSLIVLMASVVSQSAALVASGTLLKEGSSQYGQLSPLAVYGQVPPPGHWLLQDRHSCQCILFQGSLGLRVTAIEYSLVETANVMIIVLLSIFLP